MTARAPDWRAIRDRVRAIVCEAERLAAELPAPLVEAFRENMAEITAEAEAAEMLIRAIEPGDDPDFDEGASLAELWQIAAAATVAQVKAMTPIIAAAGDAIATHAAPASVN